MADVAPMEFMDPETGIIFQWSGGTQINVGRPWVDRLDGDAPEDARQVVWDRTISVYDYETGRVAIPREYEAFKARCLGWLEDERGADNL